MSRGNYFRQRTLTISSRKIARGLLAVPLLGALLLAGHGQNQDPARTQRPRRVEPTENQKPDDTVRIDTDLVSVDVSVTDAEGRTVRTLQQKDFKLFEDGIEQRLAFFHMENRSGETRPLAIVFALDISGSMTPE